MKSIAILFLLFFFGACTPEENYIYYSYNKTTITRVDRGNHIFFYFGKYEKQMTLPQSYIEETYSGLDGGMDAFLIIKDDEKAEIVPAAGQFKTINKKDDLLLKEFKSNLEFINWEKKIKHNYLNVCRLSHVIEIEIRFNKENNSKVRTIYP